MKQWLFKLLKKWPCLPSTMIDSHELDFARTVGKRLDEHRELIRALPSVLLQSDHLATVDPLCEDWEKTKDE